MTDTTTKSVIPVNRNVIICKYSFLSLKKKYQKEKKIDIPKPTDIKEYKPLIKWNHMIYWCRDHMILRHWHKMFNKEETYQINYKVQKRPPITPILFH